MCGIAGFLDRRSFRDDEARDLLAAMTGAISHRGPDADGSWHDGAAGVALGHRRLSIIDLSPAGGQPMTSADGRWVIVYNGEIYNFERLKRRLEAEGSAPAWRGHSDTEVLLAAISAWGLDAALEASIGMFALALWDRQERRLSLARDRAGEKPLYYGRFSGVWLFGSELKALRRHPVFAPAVSRAALAGYLRHGYVLGEQSIYEDVLKVPPGGIVTFDADAEPKTRRYWMPPQFVADATLSDPSDATSALEELLTDAVGLQMRSDVPMGAFLSGGIDSSTIVALMQAQATRPVRTFSIGFREAGFDEAGHAKQVADRLGTQHQELYVSAADALAVVPQLPTIYDEPFADPSQIPTFLLAKLTRESVTVALSGDAGDELFGGYARYLQANRFDRLTRLPGGVRRLMAAGLRLPPPALAALRRAAPSTLGSFLTPERLPKLRAAFESDDIRAVYRRLVSQWPDPSEIAPGLVESAGPAESEALFADSPSAAEWMMAVDFRTYLPDDILVKVDRAAMAASLETRVPMLDHRVVELAARLPLQHKIAGATGKGILRRILDRYVPRDLVERPKQGFSVPIGDWLKGPLRDWSEDLLARAARNGDGLLDHKAVAAAHAAYLRGDPSLHYPLWTVLMYEAWREANI